MKNVNLYIIFLVLLALIVSALFLHFVTVVTFVFTQSMIEINQLPKAGLMALDQAQNNAPVITRSGFQFLLMERSSQVINECSDGSH